MVRRETLRREDVQLTVYIQRRVPNHAGREGQREQRNGGAAFGRFLFHWSEIPLLTAGDKAFRDGFQFLPAGADLLGLGGGDLDLTDVAAAEGILGSFNKLERAYSIGVNASGKPVVTGYGKYADGSILRNRAFVMVVNPPAQRPQITSVGGAGTGTITVNYTNTIAGKTYTLLYNTNLSATNWYSAGSKAAAGTSDSQTESSVASGRRFYRLSYSP